MIIYPAIDIKNGNCVRLTRGEFDKETVFSDNPVEMAINWENQGAKFLHLVDLDGAKTGQPRNQEVIIEIANKIKIPVQVGGGIRDIKTVENYMNNGIKRVIIGTAGINDRAFLEKVLLTYGEKIVVGIDAKDGMVAINGWIDKSDLDAIEFAQNMQEIGVKTIIYTDISRDGMLTGPNFEAMNQMAKSVSIDVIASGGVSCIEDVKDLNQTGVKGVIIGKAIYTGDVDLKEALKC